MLQIKKYNQAGEQIGVLELPKAVFDITVDPKVIQQATVSQQAEKRKSIAHTKTRGEVRGGGIKPWKQKGTGRARQGSIRSPLWVGGGVAFGPRNTVNYKKSINKKAKRKALFMSLTAKLRDQKILALDALLFEKPKTKDMARLIEKLQISKSALFVSPKTDMNIIRSINNIPNIDIIRADSLNIVDILKHQYLVLLQDSVPVIEKTYL